MQNFLKAETVLLTFSADLVTNFIDSLSIICVWPQHGLLVKWQGVAFTHKTERKKKESWAFIYGKPSLLLNVRVLLEISGYLLTQLSIQPVFYKCMENSLPLTQRFILQFMKFHSSSRHWAETEVELTSLQLTDELSWVATQVSLEENEVPPA